MGTERSLHLDHRLDQLVNDHCESVPNEQQLMIYNIFSEEVRGVFCGKIILAFS